MEKHKKIQTWSEKGIQKWSGEASRAEASAIHRCSSLLQICICSVQDVGEGGDEKMSVGSRAPREITGGTVIIRVILFAMT